MATSSDNRPPDNDSGDNQEQVRQQGLMLENRVRKRHRHLRKWARRNAVTCYRIYERDIPEIPLAIDLYTEESGRQHLYVAYYQSRGQSRGRAAEELDEARLAAWSRAMAEAAGRGLAGDRGAERAVAVHIKERRRQRGSWQYQRTGDTEKRFAVIEGGHRFLVNLDDHLDTGLFLDHRPLRARIQREAQGCRFLNLFCYTGAITVYAAAGGAHTSESVDLSQRYLSWAEDNFASNGIDAQAHRLVRADVFEFLRARPARAVFDLAVLDPPTFSNSKKMRGVLDIQRDHPALIRDTLALLRPGGVLYFSCNFRRFKLDIDGLANVAECTDISAQTIPEDFRDQRIHQCYRIVAGS